MSAATTTPTAPAHHQSPPRSSSPHSDHADSSFISMTSSSSSLGGDASGISFISVSQDHDRRRRKRTTALDKTVLEAAYQLNTKPDKQARLGIVSRVSMNEKEIWFQNRRQNDRRKSRPLSIHEVESLRYRSNGVHIAPSTSAEHLPYTTAAQSFTPTASVAAPLPTPFDHAPTAFRHNDHHYQASNPRQSPTISQQPSRSASPRELPHPSPPNSGSIASLVTNASIAEPPAAPPAQARDPDLSFSSTTPCQENDGSEYPAERRSSHDSFIASQTQTSTLQPPQLPSFRPELSLPALSSLSHHNPDSNNNRRRTPLSKLLNHDTTPANPFKIRLSLEGKAELAPSVSPPRPGHQVYTPYGADPIPHPPRLVHPHTTESTSLPPISSLLNCSPIPRIPSGRSRSSQAWEQVADTSDPTPTVCADLLVTQAEDEVSGSARAAISLIRQNSSSNLRDMARERDVTPQVLASSNVLANNNGKRNAATSNALGKARGGKKARLGGRTKSTLTCLATPEKEDGSDPLKKKGKGDGITGKSPTDSDKENWSPDSNGNPRRRSPRSRRRGPPAAAMDAGRKILEESNTVSIVSGGKRLFAGMVGSVEKKQKKGRMASPGVAIFEDIGSDHEEADENHYAQDEDGMANGRQSQDMSTSFDTSVADDEVERFMRGDVSPSKKGDADAVHGLLSLKGAWSSSPYRC